MSALFNRENGKALLFAYGGGLLIFHAGVLFSPFMLFLPLPFLYLGFRKKGSLALLGYAMVVGTLFLLYPLSYGTEALLFFPILPVLLIGIRRKRPAVETVGLSAFAFALTLFLGLFLWGAHLGVPILDWVEERMIRELHLSGDLLLTLKDGLVFFPAAVIMVGAVASLFNYYGFMAILRKKNPLSYILFRFPLPAFSNFTLPGDFGIGILILLAGSYLLQGLGYSMGVELRMNLMALVAFFLTVAGMASAEFFLKKRLSPLSRVLLLGLTFVIGSPIFLLLGTFDLLFKLRGRTM